MAIVAAAVEALAVHAAEVADARQGDVDQAVEEFVHLVAAQRDLAADRHVLAQLEVAIDLRDLVTTGFWPAIAVRSATAPSMFLLSLTASPTPMLMTILSSFGTCIGFL